MSVKLPRPPHDDDELWWVIKLLWGVELPRVRVCADHVSPFEAVSHAYFARQPNFAVWYASRGSGKSLALATLGLTKSFVDDADVTILGGSMTQSLNVREHMRVLMAHKRAPVYAVAKDTATLIELHTGRKIRPLPASQTTVRGPHPPLQLLDEVDEMELAIYEASLGQAMEQTNVHGRRLAEYIVASSTWQNPEGTFTEVIERARSAGQPIFTWCWRELLEPHGWMTKRFIDNKRKTVSAQMWHTEYELNEPSGASRAFDLDRVEEFFVAYPNPIRRREAGGDDLWVWEEPQANGRYAAGADWAKERDSTVFLVARTDVYPRRLVYARKMEKLPYDEQIKRFDELITQYRARGAHDKTGLGNVVHDMLQTADDDQVVGFNFAGSRKRSQMLLAYIADFEHGGYRLPAPADQKDPACTWQGPDWLKRAHRSTTTADVYAPHKWDSHLPDPIASAGLMHYAAGRIPDAGQVPLVPKIDQPRKATADFEAKPYEDGMTLTVGEVSVVDERYDGVFVPYLG